VDKSDCVIYVGSCFTVEWYYDEAGYSRAFEYFLSTSQVQKRKFLVLVKRIAEFGKIFDKTKFRNEGNDIYAFKPQPDRYLSFFIKDKKIIVTNGFCKKTDKLPKSEKELAIRYMEDYLNKRQEGEFYGNNI
jgi:phage-related protein